MLQGTIIICLTLVNIVLCQLSPDDTDIINNFMEELMACRGMPGTAISLIQNKEIVLTIGYGFANLADEEPVTEDTLFAIASISKSVTTTLMSKLFNDPESSLNWDSVAAWATEEVMHLYDGYVTNHTMFRDLVSHQTGIPRYDTLWGMRPVNTRSEVIERLGYMEPRNEFRSEFLYNNNMYTLAVYPIEQITSTSYEDLVRQELFEPLGMGTSTFYHQAGDEYTGFATPYYYDIVGGNPNNLTESSFDTWKGVDLTAAAASVSSTATDMGKWLRFILNDGENEEGLVIVTKEALERLWYPEISYPYGSSIQKPFSPVTDSTAAYGLGYSIGHYRGYRSYSHGGDLTGFHSEVFMMPDMNIASFFTTNFGGITNERGFIHRFLADVLLGIEPTYNASQVCEILGDYDEQPYASAYDANYLQNIPAYKLQTLLDIGFSNDEIAFMEGQANKGFTGISKTMAKKVSDKIINIESEAQSIEWVHLDNYTGTYGHFALGNLTVSILEEEECGNCLFMEYGTLGKYRLYPTENDRVFEGVNELYMTIWSITPVIFSGNGPEGRALYADPVLFEIYQDTKFERDLKMADAPPPDNDSCY